ncbi:MAG: SRPBCC domain-containing protein [Patescibacteria group bacterium]
MKQIEQTYTINAPIAKVWQALTDASIAEQWGASPAKVDPREGGEFSYWGGDIHGINTKVIPEKLLQQDWYGHDNPSWKYNVTFTFEEYDGTTTVQMLYAGDIVDEQKDIADWRDYYFDPIKKLLENRAETL